MDDKASITPENAAPKNESPLKEESNVAVAITVPSGGVDKPPPPAHPYREEPADAASKNASVALDATPALKMPSLPVTVTADAPSIKALMQGAEESGPMAGERMRLSLPWPGAEESAAMAGTTVSPTNPSLGNFGNSSGSESEHLLTATISTSTATTAPSLSSDLTSSSNGNTTAIDNNSRSLSRLRSKSTPSQWKAPSHSCISRPSSLSSKSRGSSKPHHAYFASSEEESEAELDEKDSHSSRASRQNYHLQRHLTGMGKNNLRGRGKLAEIASKVSHHSPISLHSSRVRMTIPQNHCDATNPHQSTGRKDSGSSKPIASIYKTTTSSRSDLVPPPPQTVTVAVGNSNISDDQKTPNTLPSPGSTSSLPHDPLRPSSTISSTLRRKATAAAAAHVNIPYTSPIRKRLRKKVRRQKHLPRGLPVFKDPRSCMWTSTHDANAPSEDRYSSLVNVLLRPPKTPRGVVKKGSKNKNNNSVNNDGAAGGVGASGGGGSQSGSGGDGSSDGEENLSVNQQQKKQAAASTTGLNHPTPSASNGATVLPPSANEEEDDDDNTSLIRLSLWSVIDGHGGGCVATYAAEVLLPHIAASVARALKSEIVDRGVCNVNGQLRDANALDLDGLIRSSDRSRHAGSKSQARQREAGIDVVNPNSIHYRSPWEDSESEGDAGVDHVSGGTRESTAVLQRRHHRGVSDGGMRSESESEAESEADGADRISVASSLLPGRNHPITRSAESVTSSVKTSVKTAVSPVTQHAPVGTHSPAEVASITRAITNSFLAVDEGWINSIDPVTTHQTSCVSNGRWNAGACALVVFIVQRLDWCRSSRSLIDHEISHPHREGRGSGGGLGFFEDTSHNKDAARRRKLDYATKKCKSVSSLSTLSSTSSITTEACTTEMLVEESEITETEDDDDDASDIFGQRMRRRRKKGSGHHHHGHIDDMDDPRNHDRSLIATPDSCHYYRPHDAMLYTAHVGDCRAVMLGSAPPRTIKVPPDRSRLRGLKGARMGMHDDDVEDDNEMSLDHSDRSEDEQSVNSSNTSGSVADEISSSEHDSDSSGDMLEEGGGRFLGATAGGRRGVGYVRRGPSKRQRRSAEKKSAIQPFVPLPPLRRHWSSEESAVESDDSMSTTAQDEEHDLPPVGSIHTTPHTAVGRGVVRSVGVDDVRGVGMEHGGVGGGSELLETEDEIGEASEEDDEIKEIRSVRSGSPTQMDRPPSPTQLVADPVHPPPLPLSMLMRPIDLTTDHSAYNPAEVTAVLRRCNNAPRAISSASGGGIKRVAGSLAVTRALGDAYLKTPRLSFFPYKRHAPYITARPEVNCRVLTKGADRILTLASDGVWERASGDDVLRWVRNYYNARIAGVKEQHLHYHGNHDIDDEEQHDHYDEDVGDHTEKSLSRRNHGGEGSGSSGRLSAATDQGEVVLRAGDNSSCNVVALLDDAAAVGSGSEISSRGDGGDGALPREEKGFLNLTPLTDDTTIKPSEDESADNAPAALDGKKTENSNVTEPPSATMADAASNEMVTTTADVMATTTKTAGAKRKQSAVDETSASSRSANSTKGSARGGRGSSGTATSSTSRAASSGGGHHRHGHRHHHLRSSSSTSRPSSLAIPTVSDVIVRKVLNKVRKTRNISSLRMLMSLPKGRARRSKHDDITASVVDLSGFVS